MLKEIISYDPHHVLGLHEGCIRLYRPGTKSVHIELKGKIVEMKAIGEGLFEILASGAHAQDYRVYHANGLLAHDPYAFLPTFGELDAHFFSMGVHYELYKVMGAHLAQHQAVAGVKFSLWAPNAAAVSLVGDFNMWDGRVNPMRSMGSCGVWELFIPGLKAGEKYKFEIRTKEGELRLKADPYALGSELRPSTASVVADVNAHQWKDVVWMQERARFLGSSPLNIYEVHLGSWKMGKNYRELAHELAAYCKKMHFSHVELMPVMEHPLDESWGYQVTGFFAPTSRYGSFADFQYFVDHLHQEGIGVILDWVPAHFPMDDCSLARFDGTCLYEHEDPRQGVHPHWNTCIFNYGRKEVVNFLIASALFWLDRMHVDGLRVDAVASMLYLDYGRAHGEWIPNRLGGKENLEAIEFIKHMNAILHERFPSALVFAEESTSFTGVTHPLQWGGLGFSMKWNMGWMNDTLGYFHKDPFFRHYHINELTFGLLYAFSERFCLVLSHDEVVHGKGSLLSKMPGDCWQKFANMRLLYSYLMCQPGKKLLFMGGEIAQGSEWDCRSEIPWNLLELESHKCFQEMVSKLNQFYHEHSALWEFDFDSRGFEWIDCSDRANSVISYLRKSNDRYLACVHNFTPSYFLEYFIGLGNVKKITEVFNTDAEEFGGSGKVGAKIAIVKTETGKKVGFTTPLSPLATMLFEVQFES